MVEIIPKPAPKTPLWQNVIFYLAVFLAVISVASYFILNYYQEKASLALKDVEIALEEDETRHEISILEKEIFNYREKITDFSGIFYTHQYVSKIFNFIESVTHPRTVWLSFDFDVSKLTLSLIGQTQSFQTLGQQFLILKGQESIEKIELFDIKLEKEGEIVFMLKINFNSNFLK